MLASGATLFKAVKVAVQSEKTAVFVKPIAVYAVKKLTRSDKMKQFFAKIRQNIKNNPITLITAIVELVVCCGLGYVLLDFLDQFPWAVGWKLKLVAFGGAGLIYATIAVLTIYLGHDNPIFASIRKIVKFVGGEKAFDVLEQAMHDTEEKLAALQREKEAEEAEKARVAEQKAKDEAIYAKILEEERAEQARQAEIQAKKEEAEKQAKIAAYKAAHPGE